MLTSRTSARENAVASASSSTERFALPGQRFEGRRLKMEADITSQGILNDATIQLRKDKKLDDSSWTAFQKWKDEWDVFNKEWHAFAGQSTWNWVTGVDESSLQGHEARCYQLRVAYEAIPGVEASAVPIAAPYKPPPDAYDWMKALVTVAQWTVVGLGIYYGGRLVYRIYNDSKSPVGTPPRALGGAAASTPELEPTRDLPVGAVAGAASGASGASSAPGCSSCPRLGA